MDPGKSLALLALLTGMSFYFSVTEMAMVSVGRVRLKLLLSEHPRKARALQMLHDDPNMLITTLAMLNNFVNLLASSVATLLLYRLLNLTASETALLATLIVTFYTLILAEITPKHLGKNNPERFTLLLITPLWWAARLLRPLVTFFRAASAGLIRLLPQQYRDREQIHVSEDHIKMLIDMSKERGLITENEVEMIRRIFAYDDLLVKHVMIPRTEVVAIEIDAPLAEVRERIAREGHSRYPVYEENLDNVTGILHAKDLLHFGFEETRKLQEYKKKLQDELPAQLRQTKDPAQVEALRQEQAFLEAEVRRLREFLSEAELQDLLRPTFFTPMTKPINRLLREFQKNKQHMAVVVDEYSGTAGIVTLEDILEEIVGDIRDEHDEAEDQSQPIRRLGENTYLVDAATPVDALNQKLRLSLPLSEGATVNGLLLSRFADIPKTGDSVVVDGAKLTIAHANEREILQVKLELIVVNQPQS